MIEPRIKLLCRSMMNKYIQSFTSLYLSEPKRLRIYDAFIDETATRHRIISGRKVCSAAMFIGEGYSRCRSLVNVS